MRSQKLIVWWRNEPSQCRSLLLSNRTNPFRSMWNESFEQAMVCVCVCVALVIAVWKLIVIYRCLVVANMRFVQFILHNVWVCLRAARIVAAMTKGTTMTTTVSSYPYMLTAQMQEKRRKKCNVCVSISNGTYHRMNEREAKHTRTQKYYGHSAYWWIVSICAERAWYACIWSNTDTHTRREGKKTHTQACMRACVCCENE